MAPEALQLDWRGLKCPAPIINTAKAARKLRGKYGRLEILADDDAFPMDLESWCRASKAEVLSIESRGDGVYQAVVAVNPPAQEAEVSAPKAQMLASSGKMKARSRSKGKKANGVATPSEEEKDPSQITLKRAMSRGSGARVIKKRDTALNFSPSALLPEPAEESSAGILITDDLETEMLLDEIDDLAPNKDVTASYRPLSVHTLESFDQPSLPTGGSRRQKVRREAPPARATAKARVALSEDETEMSLEMSGSSPVVKRARAAAPVQEDLTPVVPAAPVSTTTSQVAPAAPAVAALPAREEFTSQIRMDLSQLAPEELADKFAALDALGSPDIRVELVASEDGVSQEILQWCGAQKHQVLKLDMEPGAVRAIIELNPEARPPEVAIQPTETTAVIPASLLALEKKFEERMSTCTILVLQNDLEMLLAALMTANGAAASNMKTRIYFSFWGVNLLRGENPQNIPSDSKPSFMQRMFKWMMPKGPRRQQLGKLNFGGMGTNILSGIMQKNNLLTVEQLMQEAQELDVEFVICTTSMTIMGLEKRDLMPLSNLVFGGVTGFMTDAQRSGVSLVF